MQNRNFLADFLTQNQPQQPQAQAQPSVAAPVAQDENQQLISALQQQPKKVEGVVPLAELSTREALAKSLLSQANDRNAHPLARGIAAYFGATTLQDVGAEKGRTQGAIAKAEAERKRLERDEELELKRAGLDIQRAGVDLEREGMDIKREANRASIEANRLDRDRQAQQDSLNTEDKQRRLQLEERKLQLEEAKTAQTISSKEAKTELANIEREANIIDGVASAEQTIKQIDELLAHPGFTGAVGSGFQKSLPFFGAGNIDEVGGGFAAGSDAASFSERLKQLKGGAFLEARQFLKGGGAISDTESNKAEAAQTRMSLAQSEDEFIAAATEYKGIIEKGLGRQKEQAKKLGLSKSTAKQDAPAGFEGYKIRGRK